MNDNSYKIGHSVIQDESDASSNFENGSDVVFIVLPCPYLSVDYSKVTKQFDDNTSNRRYTIFVSENDASIAQSSSGRIYNVEQSEFEYLNKLNVPGRVSKSAFDKALHLAGSLFTQRLAKNRNLVFTSCGNCLPYKLNSFKYAKALSQRNIVVHSIGIYGIESYDSDENEIIYSYNKNENKVFLFDREEKSFYDDYLDSYSINHNTDMCAKLATDTSGLVIDVRQETIMKSALMVLNNSPKKFSYQLGRCEKLERKSGDLTDFAYKKQPLINENAEIDY